MPIRAILFDLDGTLVQTREASWALFERTNREFGLGIDSRDQFFGLFQDNLLLALPRLCPDQAVARAAIDHFMALLRSEYLPGMIPGMADVVRSLASHCVLGILSTNASAVIHRITDKAGLSNCFAHVFAGDVEPDKRVSIRRFLADPSYATLRAGHDWYDEEPQPPLSPDEVALVTDTVGDIRHARECGIRALAVSWGMHSPKALLEAGAEEVAWWPQEILQWASAAPVSEAEAEAEAGGDQDIGQITSIARRRRREQPHD
ncbi:HAD family hydrolase [Zavarzinia compransoris]|uniref:phosphoglycolate phosphatase n=1 Tax=Zavarzinia compransoris TaxID=1264899 RepID=A0A317E3I8_9PROT|nr:HAD hydrolase-like protein [Zavarzinia compransoris]PWR21678.1 HAD family hydrolase [Zavarzinia compransoris]TDP45539.1 phosphoglycolate phosphatase [Zavarzinia compransoris]